MIWIFALGVLGLAIYHPGFRKVCFWIGGISAGLIAICIGLQVHEDQVRKQRYNEQVLAQTQDPCDTKPFDALKYSQCKANQDELKSF